MRGRQQYYLTIGCASNWPGLAPHPWRDMPIFRRQEWAGWGYVQGSGGPVDMSGGGREQRGACPILAGRSGGGTGRRGQEWAGWGHVQPWGGPVDMSGRGRGQRGACPFFAGRSGLFGPMSSPRTGRGACPAEEPQAGAGRLNWAKLESSGILVSAFDSEATGEFA